MLTLDTARFHIYHGDDALLQVDPVTRLEPAGGWQHDKYHEIIVSGHSHKAQLTRGRDGTCILLNPGSAGPPRFNVATSGNRCALVHVPERAGEVVRFSVVDWSGGKEAAVVTPWALEDEEEGKEVVKAPAASTAPATSRKRTRCATPLMMDESSHDSGDGFVRVGTIGSLHLKPQRGAPMKAREHLTLVEQEGIAGDAHAGALSPRQLLLASSPIMSSLGLEPGALAENIVLDLDAAHGESWWPPPSGSVVRIGGAAGGAALRVTFPCEPCANVVARAGVATTATFKGWQEKAWRGLLATVVSGGEVRQGDEVYALLPPPLAAEASASSQPPPVVAYSPSFSTSVSGRLRDLIACVPAGRVATYSQLVAWAGAHPINPYLRTVPNVLKAGGTGGTGGGGGGGTSGDAQLPVWRVVDSRRMCVPQHVPEQRDRLAAEGVSVSERGEVAADAVWQPTHAELYLRAAP